MKRALKIGTRFLGAFLLLLVCSGCKRSVFLLPGQLVLSYYGWDRVAYFNGVRLREVLIRRTTETTFVDGAQIGPDGNTYGISYSAPFRQPGATGNSIVSLNSDGSTRISFKKQGTSIIDFAAIPSSFVILTRRGKDCPTIVWVGYDGKELKTLSAPCNAEGLAAATADNLFVATDQGIQLMRGNRFGPPSIGYDVTWINSHELMYYTDHDRCTWRYDISDDARTKVVCGDWFAGAASADGRYVCVRVLTTEDWHDIPELRVVDTLSGRYLSVIRGPIPRVFWAKPTSPQAD